MSRINWIGPNLFPMRLALYLAAVAGAFQGIVLLAGERSWEELALEGGYIEVAQTLTIAACSVGFLHLAWRSPYLRPAALILAILAFAAVVREFNNADWYTRYAPGWLKAGILSAGMLMFALRFRSGLLVSAAAMARRPSGTLLC